MQGYDSNSIRTSEGIGKLHSSYHTYSDNTTVAPVIQLVDKQMNFPTEIFFAKLIPSAGPYVNFTIVSQGKGIVSFHPIPCGNALMCRVTSCVDSTMHRF